MLLLNLAFLPQSDQVSSEKEPTTILVVRRPEETSPIPPDRRSLARGQAAEMRSILGKARAAAFSDRREGDTLYLFSPEVLPIETWREESRARRHIAANLTADGTIRIKSDSEEGRMLLSSLLGKGEDYGDEMTMRIFPLASVSLKREGRTIDFSLNPPLKPASKIPIAKPRERKGKAPEVRRIYANAQAIREDYVIESAGAAMFLAEETLTRRKIAFGLIEEMAKEHLKAEADDTRLLYAALASRAIDASLIPTRGTSFGSLSPAVRDDVENSIRTNPTKYGFADEQEATKWLAGASVARSDVQLGLGFETDRSGKAVVLAQRRY